MDEKVADRKNPTSGLNSEDADSTPEIKASPSPNDAAQPGTSDGRPDAAGEEPALEAKQPSKLKQLWTKTGLDAPTLIIMFKGSLPPIIAIAAYQSPAWAAHFTTLGYLVAIASVLGFCIMPRGKFIQTMSLNILSVCFAAALNLLALYCVTQARLHTTLPDAIPGGYNSSSSAVAAIWLVFFVYCINAVRASRPQFQFPAILTSIFCIVSLSYGVLLPDMAAAIAFEKKLLEAFLTGFAIATGVSFIVFPMSSRTVVFKEMTGYLSLLSALVQLQGAFMASVEDVDPDALRKQQREENAANEKKGNKKKSRGRIAITSTPISDKLRDTLTKLFGLHAKLSADITPAKREFAIGKLESHDLTELWKIIRLVSVPVMGLCTLMNILEGRAEMGGWENKDDSMLTEEQIRDRDQRTKGMRLVMKQLHKPFADMTVVLDGGFTHVLLTLELVKPPKKQKQEDEEIGPDAAPKPGSSGFVEFFKKKVDEYYASKEATLRELFHEQGIELPSNFFAPEYRVDPSFLPSDSERDRRRRQLFFFLYLEHLLWRVGAGLLDLIIYVEKRKSEGALARSKFIFPGSKTLYKWVRGALESENGMEQDSYTADIDVSGIENLDLGDEFLKRKDPEHLPPRNGWERAGDMLRKIPRFLRSDSSAFGLRVAAATMTIGIINYLEASQDWFLTNRLLWAEIMVAISMNRLAGQSTFNFVLRVLGTAVAMIASFVIWYITDGHTAGIIVFLWLWVFSAFYIVLKFPKILIVGILGLVTSILIIGYELQVRVIGVQTAESNGQPAYPVYILAPIRLATVAGGLLVAFIWTVFPYPISEGTEVRKDLAACLYLLSNYYSIVHETAVMRLRGNGGKESQKGSYAHRMEKARTKVFVKIVVIITALQANSNFSKFQLRIGGKFPREEYTELITCCQRLLQWLSLVSFASKQFNHPIDSSSSAWQRDFHALLAETQMMSHEITSLLALLSSGLSHGQRLPPYVRLPPAFRLSKRLDEIDGDILSIRHIIEPEYSAFAVLQAATQYIHTDVAKVKKHVTALVGEIDFTFHAVKSNADSATTLATSSAEAAKEKTQSNGDD